MKVLNIHIDDIPKDAVNIMRPHILGNPFVIGKDGNRKECVKKYETYLRIQMRSDRRFVNAILDLKDRDIVCCCKPQFCHGDVVKKIYKELTRV